MNEYRQCRLRRDTLERVASLGQKGQTYDQIINKILDNYEKAISGRLS